MYTFSFTIIVNFAVFQVCEKLNKVYSLCIAAPIVFLVLGPCFVLQSFVSFLVSQLSYQGRESAALLLLDS